MGTTRRLLARVPEPDLAWKPHDKSYSLGQLAAHLANLPTWASTIVERASLDLADVGDDGRQKQPASCRDILARFDANVSAARKAIGEKMDAELMAPWTLKRDGHEVFTLPRIAALRSFVMNHSIHHRGQLSVYLRLRNVPLPSIYGPTADEPL
jgi:uncharacterized damage-inducible protein DinB